MNIEKNTRVVIVANIMVFLRVARNSYAKQKTKLW